MTQDANDDKKTAQEIPPVPILIVEDDRVVAELVTLILERSGFSVSKASRFVEAMSLIESIRPKLVLLDLFLPGWSGLDLLEEMKRSGLLSKTKVLIISALGYREVVQQAIMLGADDFLVKPFDMEMLTDKVKKLTDLPTGAG
jgi:DNA-binding response OmpR family regulator